MKIETKKIKELFVIEKGTLQSTKNKSGEFTFITASKEWKNHNSYSHDGTALVIAVAASGSLGRVHFVEGKFIASDLCFILTPQKEYIDKINLKFYYALLTALSKDIVANLAKGAAKKSINKGDFGNFEIPFLPIDKQDLIASQGEKVQDVTNRLLSVSENASQDIAGLRRVVVGDLARYELKEFTISDLLIRNNQTHQVVDDTLYKRITIRMYSNGVQLRDKVLGSDIGTKKQYVVKAGQFVISKIDARNGAFGIIPQDCDGAITTADFLSYNIQEKSIDPLFLNEILSTPAFVKLFQIASQGATNRKRFKEDIFLKEKILLPDLLTQKRIVKKIQYIIELKNIIERIETNALEVKNRFLFSMLQKLQNAPVQTASTVVSPVQQAISLIVRRFQRGEMVVAKVLYIAQTVFKTPLGVSFTQQSFGPYSSEIKRAVEDGLSSRKQFFMRKGVKGMEVLALGVSGSYILNQVEDTLKQQMTDYLDKMMPHYFSSDSHSIELLATVCKIIEDEKTSDDVVIRQKLQEWKPNRFQDSETYRTISFIKKNKWDQKILQV